MPSPLWTRIVIALAAVLWFAAAWVLDAPVDATWLKPAGGVMSVVVLLLLGFDVLVWRWLPLWLTKRPNVRGTWAAELEFVWPLNTPPQRKPCFVVVRQTFSTVSVRMFFDISASQSRSADIRRSHDEYRLWWVYSSEAYEFDRDNPKHLGAAEAAIATATERSLDGIYWTERKTTGRLTTTGWNKTLFDSFKQAAAGSYAPRLRRGARRRSS